MIEKIIFNLLAFTLFVFMFIELIKRNDTNYVYLLIIQFIGILINFIELVFGIHYNIYIRVITYILSIFIPILVFCIQYKKKITFTEVLDIIIANYYKARGEKEKEIEELLNLTKKCPNSFMGHKKLAEVYELENEKELAIVEYEKTIELNQSENLNKDEKELYVKIGKLYGKCNRIEEAKQILSEIIEQSPDTYDASIILADIFCNEGEYKDAIQIYTMALKYRPADYNLYYNLGMTYTMLNDFQKAKENYEKAAQINSELYHGKYTLGQLSLIYGDLEEGKKYFEECINSEDVEAGSYYYLARIALIKGEIDKAINYANIAIEDDYELYEKIQKDNIFVTIKAKVNKPTVQEITKKMNITDREKKVLEHLENTCKLVGKLNNNDIQMIENVMKTKESQELKEQRTNKQRENE